MVLLFFDILKYISFYLNVQDTSGQGHIVMAPNKDDSMKLSWMASLLMCDCPNVDGNMSRLHAYLDKLVALCKVVMLYERRKLLGLLPFNLNLCPPFPFVFHFLYPPPPPPSDEIFPV
jgi:hypothetical protein